MATFDNIEGALRRFQYAPSGYLLTKDDAVAILTLIKDTYEKAPFPLQQVLQAGNTMEEINIEVNTDAKVNILGGALGFADLEVTNIAEGDDEPIVPDTSIVFTTSVGTFKVDAQTL